MVAAPAILAFQSPQCACVDRHTLGAVDLLDLANQVYLHLAGAPAPGTSCGSAEAFHPAAGPPRHGLRTPISEPSSCGEHTAAAAWRSCKTTSSGVVGTMGDLVDIMGAQTTGDVRRSTCRRAVPGPRTAPAPGQTTGDVLTILPPWWKVRMVSWVPGSPMDWAATMPTAHRCRPACRWPWNAHVGSAHTPVLVARQPMPQRLGVPETGVNLRIAQVRPRSTMTLPASTSGRVARRPRFGPAGRGSACRPVHAFGQLDDDAALRSQQSCSRTIVPARPQTSGQVARSAVRNAVSPSPFERRGC